MIYKIIIYSWDMIRAYKYKYLSLYWSFMFPNKPQCLRVLGKIYVERPNNVILGKNVRINYGCYFNARGKIHIGNECHLSPFVMINAGQLDLNQPDRPHLAKEVRIGNKVWIATNVIINPGVNIGDGCVIGAGAVVTRDLPPNTLCLGVPAEPKKTLPLTV